MKTLEASAPLEKLGLPSGDHWVRFHVEGSLISFNVEASAPPAQPPKTARKPTGFVQKWSGSVKKLEDSHDLWLSHINEKHLR